MTTVKMPIRKFTHELIENFVTFFMNEFFIISRFTNIFLGRVEKLPMSFFPYENESKITTYSAVEEFFNTP